MKNYLIPKEPFLVWFGKFLVRLFYILVFMVGIAFSVYWVIRYLEL